MGSREVLASAWKEAGPCCGYFLKAVVTSSGAGNLPEDKKMKH